MRRTVGTEIVLLLAAVGLFCAPRDATARDQQNDHQIAELIENLGSSDYITRRLAEQRLRGLGFEAFDALKAAEHSDDLEIAARAAYLAGQIKVQWVRADDPVAVRDALKGYDDLSHEQRVQVVGRLLDIPEDQGLVAVCRLIRFEKSQQLSKQIANRLLETKGEERQFWLRQGDTIRQALGESERAACRWLRSQVLSATDNETALAQWNAHLEEEQKTAIIAPSQSDPAVLVDLMRHQAHRLREAGQRPQAVALMLRIIDLEDGNPETLSQLLRWLAEQQAWGLVQQVVTRFDDLVQSDAYLLYTLAEVRLVQGKDDQANPLAEKALALNAEGISEHYELAGKLRDQGMKRWAEKEFRHIIKLSKSGSHAAILVSLQLSEMLHDQARELAAAEVLGEVVHAMHRDKAAMAIVKRLRTPGAVQSRCDYFLAMHAALEKKWDKHKTLLDRAIRHDPTDADVLIALYRLPNDDEAHRAKVIKMIHDAAGVFRQQIEEEPDDPSGYNQFAWLIGNTVGDFDEAVQFSHRSLELLPDTAGYLDTLAHCYYGKGDYANAVKYQQEAARLDPHSELISRQLAVFKKALQDSRPSSP